MLRQLFMILATGSVMLPPLAGFAVAQSQEDVRQRFLDTVDELRRDFGNYCVQSASGWTMCKRTREMDILNGGAPSEFYSFGYTGTFDGTSIGYGVSRGCSLSDPATAFNRYRITSDAFPNGALVAITETMDTSAPQRREVRVERRGFELATMFAVSLPEENYLNFDARVNFGGEWESYRGQIPLDRNFELLMNDACTK